MNLSLLELKRYALQEEVEITFRETSSNRTWKVCRDGIVRFGLSKSWGQPLDHSPESILDLAEEFSLEKQGKLRLLNQAQMSLLLGETMRKATTSRREDAS